MFAELSSVSYTLSPFRLLVRSTIALATSRLLASDNKVHGQATLHFCFFFLHSINARLRLVSSRFALCADHVGSCSRLTRRFVFARSHLHARAPTRGGCLALVDNGADSFGFRARMGLKVGCVNTTQQGGNPWSPSLANYVWALTSGGPKSSSVHTSYCLPAGCPAGFWSQCFWHASEPVNRSSRKKEKQLKFTVNTVFPDKGNDFVLVDALLSFSFAYHNNQLATREQYARAH